MKEVELEVGIPFLIPYNKFISMTEKKEVTAMDETLYKVEWVRMSRKNLIEREYELLSKEAQACCTENDDYTLDFDGIFCLVHKTDEEIELPEWWQMCIDTYDKLDVKNYYGSYVVASSLFLDEYKTRLTKEIYQLSLTITLDWEKLRKLVKCMPVPVVDHINNIVIDETGGVLDETMKDFASTKENATWYIEDKSVIYPNFYSEKVSLCMQDIVFHGCPLHDQVAKEEFTYSYETRQRKVTCKVTPLEGTKIKLHFTTEKKEDPYFYLVWNGLMNDDMMDCILSITDASTYRYNQYYEDDKTSGIYFREQEGDNI